MNELKAESALRIQKAEERAAQLQKQLSAEKESAATAKEEAKDTIRRQRRVTFRHTSEQRAHAELKTAAKDVANECSWTEDSHGKAGKKMDVLRKLAN